MLLKHLKSLFLSSSDRKPVTINTEGNLSENQLTLMHCGTHVRPEKSVNLMIFSAKPRLQVSLSLRKISIGSKACFDLDFEVSVTSKFHVLRKYHCTETNKSVLNMSLCNFACSSNARSLGSILLHLDRIRSGSYTIKNVADTYCLERLQNIYISFYLTMYLLKSPFLTRISIFWYSDIFRW